MTRVAIVTGAAGGIGGELVRALSGAGYSIVAIDHVASMPVGPTVQHVQVDLARLVNDDEYSDVKLREIEGLINGKLHLLVNNAAVQLLGPMSELSLQDFRTTIDVNLIAAFLLAKRFLPELEAVSGCVINIGSIHARLTKPAFVAYSTSKAALAGLTKAMAVDLMGRVRVNSIEPAAIDTSMLREGFAGDSASFAKLALCHPSGVIGQAGDVARMVLGIAEGGAFLNGACFTLDGAISSRLHDPV